MKRIFLVLVILVIVANMTSICFAETPQGNMPTVAETVYLQQEPIAQGDAGKVESATNDKNGATATIIAEENTPKALPKTGGIPEEAFYAIGGILVITALLISLRRSKLTAK